MAYRLDNDTATKVAGISALTHTQIGSISNSLTASEWNDTIFKTHYGNIARTYLFMRGDTEVVSKLCLKFQANYLGLVESDAETLIGLYKSIWPAMQLKNQYVFQSIGDNALATYAEDQVDITAYRFPGNGIKITTKGVSYTREDVRKYWAMLIEMRDKDHNSRLKLINLTGFIMINCLRLIKKESTCLDLHMLESGTRSFQSLYDGWLKRLIPPPGGSFTLHFQASFPGNDSDSRNLFACLVNEWIDRKENTDFLGLLKAGGMLALADNGLGLISWTQKAAEIVGVELGSYMTATLVNQAVISSMIRLMRFITRADKGISWPWCRLFNETALFDLSTKRNKDACALNALVVLGKPDKLLNMSQFKDMEVYIGKYITVAQEVINHFSGMAGGIVGSEAALQIMTNASARSAPMTERLVARQQPAETESEEEESEPDPFLENNV